MYVHLTPYTVRRYRADICFCNGLGNAECGFVGIVCFAGRGVVAHHSEDDVGEVDALAEHFCDLDAALVPSPSAHRVSGYESPCSRLEVGSVYGAEGMSGVWRTIPLP